MRALDLLVIAVYIAALVGIGIYFARNQKTTDDYFIARGTIPG